MQKTLRSMRKIANDKYASNANDKYASKRMWASIFNEMYIKTQNNRTTEMAHQVKVLAVQRYKTAILIVPETHMKVE